MNDSPRRCALLGILAVIGLLGVGVAWAATARPASAAAGAMAASFTLSPTSLTFGTTSVGAASAPQPVTLTNTGTTSLTIASITFSDVFGQTNDCPASIGTGVSCTISVTFAPDRVGGISGSMTVTTTGGTAGTETLSGIGRHPLFTLSPGSLDFGNVLVGTTSAPQTVTLTNVDTVPVRITGITSEPQYAEADDCPRSPATLAAGASCTLTVTFTPPDPGGDFATVAVAQSTGESKGVRVAGNGVAPVTLTLTTDGGGAGMVGVSPAGVVTGPTTRQYAPGTVVTLAPTPAAGSTLTAWTLDGAFKGWANPVTLTMDRDHAMVATFKPDVAFSDVPTGPPFSDPVRALATRGIIFGYGDGTFGPEDRTLRAQMAALIARAMGYTDNPANPFSDRCDPADPANCVDDELWKRVAQLATPSRTIARGYTDAATCGGLARVPCYAPRDYVLHAQTISFITRAMVAQGYWTPRPADPALYGGVLDGSGHEGDVATFLFYTSAHGGIPDYPASGGFPAWDQPSERGWFARALWAALDSYFGVDLAGKGGFVP